MKTSATTNPREGATYVVEFWLAGQLNDVAEFGPQPRAWLSAMEWVRERVATWMAYEEERAPVNFEVRMRAEVR